MNQSWVILLGPRFFTQTQILLENTIMMNKNMEFSFLFLIIPICLATFILNLCVIMTLWKTEMTIVNQLMSLECLVNIFYTLLGTFQQSPYYRGLDLEIYCIPHLVLSNAFVLFNRLLPVAIAVFR